LPSAILRLHFCSPTILTPARGEETKEKEEMHGGERRAEGGGERDGVKAARWPPARRPRPPSPPQRGQPLRRLGCAAGSRAGGGGGRRSPPLGSGAQLGRRRRGALLGICNSPDQVFAGGAAAAGEAAAEATGPCRGPEL